MQGRCPDDFPPELADRAPGLVAKRTRQQCLLLADRDLFSWDAASDFLVYSIWLDSLYLRLERSNSENPAATATLVFWRPRILLGSAAWLTQVTLQGDDAPGSSAVSASFAAFQLFGALPPLPPNKLRLRQFGVTRSAPSCQHASAPVIPARLCSPVPSLSATSPLSPPAQQSDPQRQRMQRARSGI